MSKKQQFLLDKLLEILFNRLREGRATARVEVLYLGLAGRFTPRREERIGW